MTEHTGAENPLEPSGIKRYVPLLVYAIVILNFLCIPLKIIGYGYLPADDALRHAAKAVSGKPWSEILVLNEDFKDTDHNMGWHIFLGAVHKATGCGTETLVMLEVVALFTLFGWVAIPWLKRPEAWMITFLIIVVCGGQFARFLLGRPFLLSIVVLLAILFLWRQRGPNPPGWKLGVVMAALIALATFVHGVWYLWGMLLLAFVFAREYRWALVFGGSWITGTLAGALCTGHPAEHLVAAVRIAILAMSAHQTSRTQVTEFYPSQGDFTALVVMGALLVVRRLARLKDRSLTTNPAFWLGVIGWVLGFKALRFWSDWGWPALMFLVACDLQTLLQIRFKPDSLQRLGLVSGLAAATYLAATSDPSSRWTWTLTKSYSYLEKSNPEVTEWLPDKGGILYSGNMLLFYDTFFKNPHGDWRYILGYEPILMPPEDFKTYHNIMWNFGETRAYKPWVDKMRPEDRLIMAGGKQSQPGIAGLDWHYTVSGIWSGRLPRTNNVAPSSNRTNSPFSKRTID